MIYNYSQKRMNLTNVTEKKYVTQVTYWRIPFIESLYKQN